jgi:hypothetical protein
MIERMFGTRPNVRQLACVFRLGFRSKPQEFRDPARLCDLSDALRDDVSSQLGSSCARKERHRVEDGAVLRVEPNVHLL